MISSIFKIFLICHYRLWVNLFKGRTAQLIQVFIKNFLWLILIITFWGVGEYVKREGQEVSFNWYQALVSIAVITLLHRYFFQRYQSLPHLVAVSMKKSHLVGYYVCSTLFSAYSLLIPAFIFGLSGLEGLAGRHFVWGGVALAFTCILHLASRFFLERIGKTLYIISIISVGFVLDVAIGQTEMEYTQEMMLAYVSIGLLVCLYVSVLYGMTQQVVYKLLDGGRKKTEIFLANRLFGNEGKLLFRNRRFDTLLYLYIPSFLLFIVLQLLFVDVLEIYATNSLLELFFAGALLISYWVFFPAWDGTYFSLLMICPKRFEEILKSKYLSINFIAVIPVLFFLLFFLLYRPAFAFRLIVSFCVSATFLCYILIFFSGYNSQRLELDQSSFVNVQGYKAYHFAIMMGLVLFLQFWDSWTLGFSPHESFFLKISLIIISLLSLLFLDPLFRFLSKRILSKKYRLLASYNDRN